MFKEQLWSNMENKQGKIFITKKIELIEDSLRSRKGFEPLKESQDLESSISICLNKLPQKTCQREIFKEDEKPPIQSKNNKRDNSDATLRSNCFLNETYRFDSFLTGQSNNFAFRAIRSLQSEDSPNQLVIFGPPGNGKSHLCYALLREFEGRAMYLSSEGFVSQFVSSVYNRSLQKFREQIFQKDLLIIEDLQFLKGKEKSQQELAYIIDNFAKSEKKVILTSDAHPLTEINLCHQLKAKIQNFVICEIKNPDRTLIEKFMNLHLSNLLNERTTQILKELSYLPSGLSVRSLNAICKKIKMISANNGDISPNLIESVVLEYRTAFAKDFYKKNLLIRAATDLFKTTESDILARSKKSNAVLARSVLSYILRESFGFSFQKISEELNLKDHSSALKLYEKAKTLPSVQELKETLMRHYRGFLSNIASEN